MKRKVHSVVEIIRILRKPLWDLKAFKEMTGQAIQLRDQRQGG